MAKPIKETPILTYRDAENFFAKKPVKPVVKPQLPLAAGVIKLEGE